MRIIPNYSPNFDLEKRNLKKIKFLIFHYTGMEKENDAINRLTSLNSKVSSHYFIKKNGKVLSLVPDFYIAWHAGVSSWKNYKSLNKFSIGIEISNSGHDHKYEVFNKKQINSIVKLSKILIKKYKIKPKFILGHSDISPERKKDPGEKFPWNFLSKKKISYWHNLSKKKLLEARNKQINKIDKEIFFKNLCKIGYPQHYLVKKKIIHQKQLAKAFQRRFRQELINGKIDKECLIISINIVKKFK
tara:strand:+ start:298 stop:1032 length:735 start_codon:yes stop_codon:yes gene_type:complete